MPLANYSKPFASKPAIELILDILISNNRHSHQLCRDVAGQFRMGMDAVLNTVHLLTDQKIIVKDEDENLSISTDHVKSGSISSNLLLGILCNNLLAEEVLEKISRAIVETPKYGLCLDSNRIPQSHLTISHIFYNLQILELPKDDRFWPISQNYLSIFINSLPTGLNKFWEDKKTMSLADLKRKLENQELAGRRAEEWVLKQEQIRLEHHPLKENIILLSNDNVNAGFDIASFKNLTSYQYDKFIEVKSYSGDPKFYISSNEFAKAEELGSNYFLIIVDRDKMYDSSYLPTEIINPFNVLVEHGTPDGVIIESKNWEIRLLN